VVLTFLFPFNYTERRQDGDGELTVSDAKVYWEKAKKILTLNIPSAGGFTMGFMYGLTYN